MKASVLVIMKSYTIDRRILFDNRSILHYGCHFGGPYKIVIVTKHVKSLHSRDFGDPVSQNLILIFTGPGHI